MKARTTYHLWKRILFGLLTALLCLPALQQHLKLVKLKPLEGAFVPAEQPVFAWSDWFDGNFQEQHERALDDRIGFRELMVRVFNQYHYSLFRHGRAMHVIIGEDDYLYELNYILAYTGEDFIGDSLIQDKAEQLRIIQDRLMQKQKHLLVLLAPGKGSYYPEYIPAELIPDEPNYEANYRGFSRALSEAGVNVFDAKAWFAAIRDTSAHPLFPKTGIHWSKYGELLVVDSMLRLAGGMLEKPLPQLELGSITTSRSMRDTDDDIERGLNLLFDLPDLEMAYPEFALRVDSSTFRPSVITIADSYYWGMYNLGLSRDAFDPGAFWFYNEQAYRIDYPQALMLSELDVVAEVDAADLIVLISTDANLYRFPFGFVEQMDAWMERNESQAE